jgi:uncharacterized membrane protein (DUF4010 family)
MAEQLALRLAIAGLIGLATGLERERSGHASGPDARFAGLRTFLLLGLLGGVAGLLVEAGHTPLAAVIAGAASALCVAGYAMAARRASATTDGTTEAAALVVVALGVVAGVGWIGIAAGVGALMVLALTEKTLLHRLAGRVGESELRAGAQFAVLAVVVLPLLPAGPFLGAIALQPRALWAIVLLFSALNFAGFIARRLVGARRGYPITGALGGVISSTAVTLEFSRRSRADTEMGAPLAGGVLAACTMLLPRVLVVSAVLNPAVAAALAPMLAPPFLIGLTLAAIGRRSHDESGRGEASLESNPLQLGAALRMALAFQAAMAVIAYVRRFWGTAGVLTTAAALGLTDVDALTVSMSRHEAGLDATLAARAIVVGILANTLLKLGISVLVGRATYRRRAVTGLVALAAGATASLLWL